MNDSEILKAISNAFTSRGFELGVYDSRRGPFMDESIAHQLYEQYKRLNAQKIHPMEQGYSIIKAKISALQESYAIINDNIALCLVSDNSFLRAFAEAIMRGPNAK
jgi:hypothetical protein